MLTSAAKNVHLVYLTDDIGIASVYPFLRSKINKTDNRHISLIYYSATGIYHFRKEIEILLIRYPVKLYASFARLNGSDGADFSGEEIEALINANTMPAMSFVISGKPAFRLKLEELLRFLGVNDIRIQEQFFSS